MAPTRAMLNIGMASALLVTEIHEGEIGAPAGNTGVLCDAGRAAHSISFLAGHEASVRGGSCFRTE
jgi:hypothetical protein